MGAEQQAKGAESARAFLRQRERVDELHIFSFIALACLGDIDDNLAILLAA